MGVSRGAFDEQATASTLRADVLERFGRATTVGAGPRVKPGRWLLGVRPAREAVARAVVLLPCARGPDDAIVLAAVSLLKWVPVFQAALQIGRCNKCGIVSHERLPLSREGLGHQRRALQAFPVRVRSIGSFGRPWWSGQPSSRRSLCSVSTARPTSLPSRRFSSAALASSSRRGGMGMPGTRGAGVIDELSVARGDCRRNCPGSSPP
jgi:hypothetical protein